MMIKAFQGLAVCLFLLTGCNVGSSDLVNGGAASYNEAGDKRWVGVWSFGPLALRGIDKGTDVQTTLPAPVLLSQSMVRLIIKPTAPGKMLRLQFSNLFGQTTTTIENVYIGIHQGDGAVKPGSNIPVTFNNGKKTLSLAQKDYYSDAFTLPYNFGDELAVTLFLSGEHALVTGHAEPDQNAYVANLASADATSQEGNAAFTTKWVGSVYLTGLEALTPDSRGTLMVLGDSITDGTASDVDTNTRYSDFLAKRIQSTPGLNVQSVLNMGIGANQLLADGTAMGGISLLHRLERDVLTPNNVKYVILMIGTNDLGFSNGTVSYESMVAGYEEVAARLKARGIKVYISPMTPAKGPYAITGAPIATVPAIHFAPTSIALRNRLNAWIRANTVYDGVIDFAKVVQDPADPDKMAAEYDSGDGLHPNSTGYKAMADAIPLALFRGP